MQQLHVFPAVLLATIAFGATDEKFEELPPAWPVLVETIFTPPLCLHRAEDGDLLTIEYVGKLSNGTVVASSAPEPADGGIHTCRYYGNQFTFTLGRGEAIRGVDMGLKGMCFQERRKLTIPSHLAYGEFGTDNIPPDAELVFEYELVKIEPQFKQRTVESTPSLCTQAAGAGSQLVMDYSMHYSIFDTGRYVEHKHQVLLEDTFKKDYNWVVRLNPGSGALIKGLEEGLHWMCVNETRELVVPPHLGYGNDGIEGYIPGGATIYFRIKLKMIRSPRFEIVIDSKPEKCVQNFEGANLGIHYTSVVINGRYQYKKDPEMMETTRLNGKGPWEMHYTKDSNIIEGLYQGLKYICVGEKRTLRIPPEMAWGDGMEGYIRPNATIIFEVEAVSVSWPDLNA